MKPQHLFNAAYALGLAAVLWVAATSMAGNPLVLVMTLVIGGVYTLGAAELRRYRGLTRQLDAALTALPSENIDLPGWLSTLPAALRQPVRQRIEGERVLPPAPVVTPYLVGLLVMLGMLGTFLGMVVTLSGTAFALQSLTDIQGIRLAFSEPIRGLGLAFGASVAGVATSAMLGLMSTLVRRERMLSWGQLDTEIATRLRPFGSLHRSEEQLSLLRQNNQAMPQLVDLMGQWLTRVEALQTQLSQQLLAQQDEHHRQARQIHQALADSIDQSLRRHIEQSTQQAALQMQTMARDTMSQLASQAHDMQERLLHSNQQALQAQQTQAAQYVAQMDAMVADHLGQLGTTLEAPLARLIELSSQAPQAAAELMDQLRQRINQSTARDNELLQERAQIMADLSQASQVFGQQVDHQGEHLTDLAAQLRAGAIEVASLGESFAHAVSQLQQSQQQTQERLQQIEQALTQAMQRSDEQLSQHVAQAREVIELSLSAQKPMIEALERAAARFDAAQTA